jgi:hypothetical protein
MAIGIPKVFSNIDTGKVNQSFIILQLSVSPETASSDFNLLMFVEKFR